MPFCGPTQGVQPLSDTWLVTYNEHRPHAALGRGTAAHILSARHTALRVLQLCVVHFTGKLTYAVPAMVHASTMSAKESVIEAQFVGGTLLMAVTSSGLSVIP